MNVKRDSVEIAPPGTYTDDMEWRDQLKSGSLLDCCDDYGVWYRSSVLNRYESEKTDVEGNRIPVLHIANRYPDPESQTIHQGVRVTGWVEEEFDLFVEIGSPNLQPLNSYALQYRSVTQQELKYDVDVQDWEDVVYSTSSIQQYSCFRKYHFGNIRSIPFYLNEFGRKGGFSKIEQYLHSVAEGSTVTTA